MTLAMLSRLVCAVCIAGVLLAPAEGARVACMALLGLGVGLRATRA